MHRSSKHSLKSKLQGQSVPLDPAACAVCDAHLHAGDVYLFHRTDSRCPTSDSLWGQFDKREQSRLYLESSSLDLHTFQMWHVLPADYRYCRLATRHELRDYIFALTWNEFRRLQPHQPHTGGPSRSPEDDI